MKCCTNKYDILTRLYGAYFVQRVIASKKTFQMFVACRGLNVFPDLLESDFSKFKELSHIAISSVLSMFKLQGQTTPKVVTFLTRSVLLFLFLLRLWTDLNRFENWIFIFLFIYFSFIFNFHFRMNIFICWRMWDFWRSWALAWFLYLKCRQMKLLTNLKNWTICSKVKIFIFQLIIWCGWFKSFFKKPLHWWRCSNLQNFFDWRCNSEN